MIYYIKFPIHGREKRIKSAFVMRDGRWIVAAPVWSGAVTEDEEAMRYEAH